MPLPQIIHCQHFVAIGQCELLKMEEREMASGSDEVAEILTSGKTKEIFGYYCKLQRSFKRLRC